MINRVARGLNSDQSLLIMTLGLTAVLGVTTTFVAAVLYGLLFLFIFTFCLTVASSLHDVLSSRVIFAITVLLATLLVTLTDFLLGLYLPTLRQALGIYLPLTVVSPLLLIWGFDQSQNQPVPDTIRTSLKTGAIFWLLLGLLGLLREVLGTGGLNLWPLKLDLHTPVLTPYAPSIFVATAGGFILLGLLKAFLNYRQAHQKPQPVPTPKVKKAPKPAVIEPIPLEPSLPEPLQPEPLPIPEPVATTPEPLIDIPVAEPFQEPETPAPSLPTFTILNRTTEESSNPTPPPTEADHHSTDLEGEAAEPAWQPRKPEWGESLEDILAEIGRNKEFERKRILVIGCGTGEEAYHYAMLLLEARKANPRLNFKVRGVDNFPARVETALEGIYPEVQVDFIPLELKKAYMLKSREEEKRLARMNNDIRANLEFEVADYLSEEIYFTKPAELITINQPIDYLSEDKRRQLLRQVKAHLMRDGVLWLRHPQPRELMPEGFKRTGEKVWRKK